MRERHFSDLGFRPIETATAAQALGMLRAQGDNICTMLTDVVMLGIMNGYQLAEQVNVEWPHIQIIVASGLEWPEFGDVPAQATFVFKPLSSHILAQHLNGLKLPQAIKNRCQTLSAERLG